MSRQCWSYDQHLIVAEIFSSFLQHLLPASVVGHKTNNGVRRNFTKVGVLKTLTVKRGKMLSRYFGC